MQRACGHQYLLVEPRKPFSVSLECVRRADAGRYNPTRARVVLRVRIIMHTAGLRDAYASKSSYA